MTVQPAPATGPRGRVSRYLAPIMLATVAVAVIAVVLSAPHIAGHARGVRASQATVHRPPPYWIVQPGDTLAEVAAKTGVSVAELQALNPDVNPLALVPGQQLKLWLHPPKPTLTPVPLGPLYWTVRPGQSFGSIAAQTGINILTLEQLNPGLKSTTFWPGDRVRLRPPLLPSSSLARLAASLPRTLVW